MLGVFKSIRAGERRDTGIGFFTLFGLIASHSVLETARDALFLAKVPATHLPWVYVAIAIVSLTVTQIQARLGSGLSQRVAISVWTLVAGAVTLLFWWSGSQLGDAGVYALYIWSGVLTTLVLIHLWALLGDLFTVTQAKRVYSVIGAGSVLGAIAGTSVAGALARAVSADTLVLVSACGFGVTSLVPLAFRTPARRRGDPAETTEPFGLVANARLVARQPYALRVVALLVVAAATLTFADYLFKSEIAVHVPREQLASYLGTVYLTLNLLSAVAQLGVVSWLIRRFDISVALAVLPCLLAIGGVGVMALPGMAAVLLVKGADGGLRYSLHRTSTELLYVPLSDEARRRVKAFMDVVGQRGGQVIASVAILIAVAAQAPHLLYAGALVGLALVWLASSIDLRRHYLEIFRRRLRRGRLTYLAEFPEFDVASLETLISALDSTNDQEVLAALEVLEAEGKARLVPGLILHHPSEEVVRRALSLFASSRRSNVVPTIDRLLDHDNPQIRAAAVAARSVIDPDEAPLRMRLSLEELPEVRATIMVNLIASGAITGSDAKDALAALLSHGSAATHVALCEAVARRHASGFEDTLAALGRSPVSDVRRAAARAMGEVHSREFLPLLIEMLGDERTRNVARQGLRTYGSEGLRALTGAFADPAHGAAVRWQIPGAIGQFDAQLAAPILLQHLPEEWDGMVRYKSIRALESMIRREPRLQLDVAILERTIGDTISRAYRYLDRRLTLVRGANEEPARLTAGHQLLVNMLRDKERHTIGRLFRLLGLVHRYENFQDIYSGWKSNRAEARASSIELVENILVPRLRHAVMGLIDNMPDEDRLEAGREFHRPLRLAYRELLEHMLASSSEIVQDMTAFHIRELELRDFVPRLRALPARALQRSDIAVTLAALDRHAAKEPTLAS